MESLEGAQAPGLTCSGSGLAESSGGFERPIEQFPASFVRQVPPPVWANGGVQPGEETQVAHILFWNELGEGSSNLHSNYICLRATLELVALALVS